MSDNQTARRDALAQAGAIGEALALADAWLRAANVTETPQLDAQVLLSHVTGASRATVMAYPERPLSAEESATYADLVARRAAHEPVAYLVGHREFLGLDLLTDARALIPRPETELLVEAALRDINERLSAKPLLRIADIGVGSGAIPIAVAVREPRLPMIYATDISPDALALASENARRLAVDSRITFLQGDLLEPLPEPVDVLTANLPYVAPSDPDVGQSVHYEPALAVYGADDGLGHIRRLFDQAPARLLPGASLYLEYGYDQRAAIETLARATFPDATLHPGVDYAGWDRFIEIRLRG